MADVAIPAQWYGEGRMPRICARHGGPATRSTKRSMFTSTPVWVWLLALVSLLIAAIVALAIRRSVHGYLPACERCVRDRRRFVGSAVGGLTAGLLLFVAGAQAASDLLLVVGLLVFVAALLGSMFGDQFRVRGRLRKDLLWVELRGAAPEFTAEMSRGLQAARAAAAAHQQQTWALAASSVPYSASGDILPGR